MVGGSKGDGNSSSTIAIATMVAANGQRDSGTIVMAIAMNSSSSNGRQQWQQLDCNGQWRQQRNGWRDGRMVVQSQWQWVTAERRQHDGRW